MNNSSKGLKIGFFALVLAGLVIGAWLVYPQSPEANAGSNASPSGGNSEQPPTKAQGSDPELSHGAETATLPEPEFTSDFTILLKSVIDLAKQRDHPGARAVSLKLRESSGGHIGDLLTAIQEADAIPREDADQISKGNVVAYLALALPPDGFAELLASLRNRWTLTELNKDRRDATTNRDGYPLSSPYYPALPSADRPVAGAIGFCLLDAAGHEDHDRFTSLSGEILKVYESHGFNAPKQDFPDVWLSEVLMRLEAYKPSFTKPAGKLVKDFCARIADCRFFTERLRHQARMLIMEPPAHFTELLSALREARSEAEAGSLLRKYLDQANLTPEDLRLVLGVLRTSLDLDEATLAIGTALRGMDDVGLKRFATDALSLCLEPDVSDTEKAQLSAAVFSAANNSNYNGILRAWKATGNSRHERGPFLCDYPDAALSAIRVLIADCSKERDLGVARCRIMAYETALAIIELDISTEIKLELMTDLLKNIGGSRDSISSPVLMRLIYSHQRFSGFDAYWMAMLNLFLDNRGPQPQLDTDYTHIEMISTYEFVMMIAEFQEEFPYIQLPESGRAPLRKLFEDARKLFEQYPDYRVEIGGKEAIAAIEKIEGSMWLK